MNTDDPLQLVSSTSALEFQPSVMSAIAYYCNYIFLIFGTLSNILAVICLCKRDSQKDKNNTMRYYLIPLAVCDGLHVFWHCLHVILNGLRTPIYLPWESGCNLAALMTISTSELSSLLVMMITLNRFVALFFPLKFKLLQSINKVYCCIGILVLIVIVISWPSFGGLKPIHRDQLDKIEYFEFQCRGRTSFIDDYVFNIFSIVDACVYFIIPGLVIVVCNIAFVIKLRSLRKVNPVSSIQRNTTHGTFQSAVIKQGQHMTRICIFVSTSFLLQLFPFSILRVMILMNLVDADTETIQNVLLFLQLLCVSNHLTNFWAYFVCWKEFRERVITLCKVLCYFCKASADTQ